MVTIVALGFGCDGTSMLVFIIAQATGESNRAGDLPALLYGFRRFYVVVRLMLQFSFTAKTPISPSFWYFLCVLCAFAVKSWRIHRCTMSLTITLSPVLLYSSGWTVNLPPSLRPKTSGKYIW